jgi:uncharacterized coiled-coil protein SlyX
MNILTAIADLEIQVSVQADIIQKLSASSTASITQVDVDAFRKKAQANLTKKYPQCGFTFNG